MKVLLVEDNMELAGSISNFRKKKVTGAERVIPAMRHIINWYRFNMTMPVDGIPQIFFEESTGSTMLQKEEAKRIIS